MALLVLSACSTEPPASSGATPSPTPTVQASATASANLSGGESPVPPQVLSPASDLPVGGLCTAQITVTADGNATPLLCHSGALNVQAWRFYASVSASVLGLGLNPTQGQVQSAVCDDLNHNHATRTEEVSGYKLATVYYGWNFNLDPARITC